MKIEGVQAKHKSDQEQNVHFRFNFQFSWEWLGFTLHITKQNQKHEKNGSGACKKENIVINLKKYDHAFIWNRS